MTSDLLERLRKDTKCASATVERANFDEAPPSINECSQHCTGLFLVGIAPPRQRTQAKARDGQAVFSAVSNIHGTRVERQLYDSLHMHIFRPDRALGPTVEV